MRLPAEIWCCQCFLLSCTPGPTLGTKFTVQMRVGPNPNIHLHDATCMCYRGVELVHYSFVMATRADDGVKLQLSTIFICYATCVDEGRT